jgi:hypothetical protein
MGKASANVKNAIGADTYGVEIGKGRFYLHINAMRACQYSIVLPSHRVCSMKSINFAGFFQCLLI